MQSTSETDTLRSHGLIQPLTGRADAAALRSGDFVEFTARFDPSQLIALLDIVTPDLVRSITRKVTFDGQMKAFEGGSVEAAQAFKLRLDSRVEAAGEIAHAIASALATDFRTTKTREFYGRIGEDEDRVTAITMCDLSHFTIDDEDRVLDGQFSVLAKVTDGLAEDIPVLDRNKVLRRFQPEAVDALLSEFNEGTLADLQQQAVAAAAKGQESMAPDMFDFEIESRVAGPSIKVIPVAIYV